ncbi:hypothetical protein PHLH3_08750 [Pseudomonas sp. St386]|uniref:hypothetical protein n=1 Tax=Pseudomonas sp. St386 TaxID=2678256 RepID=UPI001BB3DE81|nr:hypothetical protein [Pseudomonas sp. St386]BBP51249.1 hypothetical protein PHLH3_08750 [Pseudomonas sp. St386]
MAKQSVLFQAFNRGIISKLALARVDLQRMALSAEEQTNWLPRMLGPMMLRPGTSYLGTTRNNLLSKMIPFIFSTIDTAMLEFSAGSMRIRVNDIIVERIAVTSVITNGEFTTDLSGWTDSDEAGATSAWSAGAMSLAGTGPNAAIRRQEVTVSLDDANKQHALRIVVSRGPVLLRVGSTAGADNFLREVSLRPGVHSITFTPSTNFHISLMNRTINAALVESIAVEAAGPVVVPAPWAETDLYRLRHTQSGDVIFVACDGYQQRRIERRSGNSWSVVLYTSSTGPYMLENTSNTTITASGLVGNITLNSSTPIFRTTNVSSIYKISSVGQKVTATITGDNQFSDPIRITGVGGTRIFTRSVTGAFTATVRLQRSVGAVGAWEDIESFTIPTAGSFNDELDNQIIFYRIGVKTGEYTSGTISVQLIYSLGSITGVARVTAFVNETQVQAEVLKALGGTTATEVWSEGAWSDRRGWPTSTALYEGRLWWAGKDKNWGSVSDAFDNFDPETEGDSGPINRNIGSGPVDTINWLLPLQRLVIGGQGAEISARSSSFDEPLTPDNYNIKECSTQGSAAVAGIKVDSLGLFVQKSGTKLFELTFDGNVYDYSSAELTLLCPEIGEPSIDLLAVQRQPDTRVHCVRGDGKVAILVYDKLENVRCFVMFETDGEVEDVAVLPGNVEDNVYYIVKRTINGSVVRFYEKWAREAECRGGQISKCADAHVVYQGLPTKMIGGLSHLEGKVVTVWADGDDVGDKTVSGGNITLDVAASNVVAGLGYRARFKSSKLAYASSLGAALLQKKRISQIGFVLADTHRKGVRFGQDFETLDDLPDIENYQTPTESVWADYDNETIEFPGSWDTDARICLEAASPRPATVLGAVFVIETNDKS